MPPYAANALPAYAASILVRHKAKRTRHGIPATAHHPLRSKRSHAQNAKHPAISKIAARIYMPVELKSVVTDCAMTARCFRYAEIRSLQFLQGQSLLTTAARRRIRRSLRSVTMRRNDARLQLPRRLPSPGTGSFPIALVKDRAKVLAACPQVQWP
jgi:hypothetical protein